MIERGSCSSAVFPYIQLSSSQVFSQVKLKRGSALGFAQVKLECGSALGFSQVKLECGSALGFAQVKLECGSVSERLPCIINLVMELTAGWRRSNASGSVFRVDHLTQNCQIHVLLSVTA